MDGHTGGRVVIHVHVIFVVRLLRRHLHRP